MVNWSAKQNVLYLSVVKTQQKVKAIRRLLMRLKTCRRVRHVLMIGKVRDNDG